jgi:hypothetical protein
MKQMKIQATILCDRLTKKPVAQEAQELIHKINEAIADFNGNPNLKSEVEVSLVEGSVDGIILTAEHLNFFAVEINNVGGESPATLDSALGSLNQADPATIASWAKMTAKVDLEEWAKEFIESIEELKKELGGACELEDVVYEYAD